MLIYLKFFARRIIKDFKHKDLLPLKLLFFIHASTLFVLYPYLTIHMRELGINVEETAIMSAVIPVVAIIMPPLAGMIADKIGNFKLLLALFSTLGGLSALLLLIVPIGRITVTYPDSVVVALSCNHRRIDSHLAISAFQEMKCDPSHTYEYTTNLTVQSCGFVCHAVTNENDSVAIMQAPRYEIEIHTPNARLTDTFKYEVVPKSTADEPDMRNHVTLKNNEKYSTTIRKLSTHSYFFPSDNLFNFSCDVKAPSEAVEYNITLNSTEFEVPGDKFYLCRFRKLNAAHKDYSISIKRDEKSTIDDELENRLTFNVHNILALSKNLKNETKALPSLCDAGFGQGDKHISVNVPLHDKDINYKTLNLGSCAPRCLATAPRKTLCSNKSSLVEKNMRLTFWSYLVVRVFIAMIGGTAFAMFEGAVIAVLRDKKADYGLQRIYASIGGMISSPLAGWMIDYFSEGKDYVDFRPAFYLYAVLKVVSGVLMLGINLDFKPPSMNVVTDVLSVLRKIELIALFISCFILGTAWGYIESFLFWFLQDLGGTRSLMGFTITVGGIAGIPLLVMSGPIIKRIGHANVIFIGFIFYGIRLLGYSLIYNPWHCLIFEAMESVTSSLSFTAAVTYAAKLSSITTDTSIQGMLGGLYYGVGKGSGSLIGGYLMEIVGTRSTYQIFAGMTVITGILYFCFNHFYIRKYVHTEEEKPEKKEDNNDIDELDISKIPVELPQGFAEPEIINDWQSRLPAEEKMEAGEEKNNGHVNPAFDNNENSIDKKKDNTDLNNVKMTENNIVQNGEKSNTDKEKCQ